MNPNDIQDAKVGTRQVTAIYLGENLVWPAVPITYVITDAWIAYSSGNTINAAGSNYAYALGNVSVWRGSTPIRTMENVHLDVSISSQDFSISRPVGFDYDVITGANLGANPTENIKTAAVTASYRGSTHSAGNVTQERNVETVTSQTVREEYDPVITTSEVPNSRYVVITLDNYNTAQHPCPAYGSDTTLSYYGGHDMANYSTVSWEDWTTVTHTFTSGVVEVDDPYVSDSGTYPPTIVGSSWGVDDTNSVTLSELPSWLTLDGSELTIASEGTTTYADGRSATITASNGLITASVTVYQQENVATPDFEYETVFGDSTITTEVIAGSYYMYVHARQYASPSASMAAPASGDVYARIDRTAYHQERAITSTPWTIYETEHWVWTSGEEEYGQTTTTTGTDVAYGTPYRAYDDLPTPVLSDSDFTWDETNSSVYIPSMGSTVYPNGRSCTITCTNGSATSHDTVYQLANTETIVYTYALSVDLLTSGTISASGGVYEVDYVSTRTYTKTYTSGTVLTGTEGYTATVSCVNATANVPTVQGSGTFRIGVDENFSTTSTRPVSVTLTTQQGSQSDSAIQNRATSPVVVTPNATISADVDTDGRVLLRLVMTQGSVTFPIDVRDVVYHYILDGVGQEEHEEEVHDIEVLADGTAVRLPVAFTWLSGTLGTHWFSALYVESIGVRNTTFEQTSFDVR